MIPTKIDSSRYPWLPYVAPMAAFLLLTSAEDSLTKAMPGLWGYPIAYAIKIALVVIVAVLCRDTWRDLKPLPSASMFAVAIVAGLAVTALWIGLDGRYPAIPLLGKRSGFDPTTLPVPGRFVFLAVRFLGLVLVVPLIEELFWRSFLMRWLIDSDFRTIPIGRVTRVAVVITSFGFALEHPEWLPALLTGLIWAGLLAWSKSVFACVVSHATANLALGAYVLAMGGEAWRFL